MKNIWLFVVLLCGTSCFAQGDSKMFTLISSAFSHNGVIPSLHTCEGKNVSPALQWINIPAGTKSFALIVDDPDAPSGIFTHWVVFNIAATTTSLAEGIKAGELTQGVNDFGTIDYKGPCPPQGKPHHYNFTLFALNKRLDISGKINREKLLEAMKDKTIGQAKLVGIYQRK